MEGVPPTVTSRSTNSVVLIDRHQDLHTACGDVHGRRYDDRSRQTNDGLACMRRMMDWRVWWFVRCCCVRRETASHMDILFAKSRNVESQAKQWKQRRRRRRRPRGDETAMFTASYLDLYNCCAIRCMAIEKGSYHLPDMGRNPGPQEKERVSLITFFDRRNI